jgi:predicted regulator of Ras-like GTPase activity (Roadblock/LC7/MglB family)
MKKGLNKFVSTKDVLGAYILDPEGIVIESDMPPKYSEEILRQIGRDLSGISGLARSDFSDAEQISFFFENAVLCMQGLNEGHLFITLTSPEMDRDVLKKTARIFINEFEQAMASPPKLALVKPLDIGKNSEQSIGAASPEDLMNSGPLSGPLGTMQTALYKVIGPMARVIFFDALEKWLTIDTPCMDSLPLLTDIVVEGIGDERLASAYKERLPSFCCSTSADSLSEKRKKNNIKVVQSI